MPVWALPWKVVTSSRIFACRLCISKGKWFKRNKRFKRQRPPVPLWIQLFHKPLFHITIFPLSSTSIDNDVNMLTSSQQKTEFFYGHIVGHMLDNSVERYLRQMWELKIQFPMWTELFLLLYLIMSCDMTWSKVKIVLCHLYHLRRAQRKHVPIQHGVPSQQTLHSPNSARDMNFITTGGIVKAWPHAIGAICA